jgi:hypothetical protein
MFSNYLAALLIPVLLATGCSNRIAANKTVANSHDAPASGMISDEESAALSGAGVIEN